MHKNAFDPEPIAGFWGGDGKGKRGWEKEGREIDLTYFAFRTLAATRQVSVIVYTRQCVIVANGQPRGIQTWLLIHRAGKVKRSDVEVEKSR